MKTLSLAPGVLVEDVGSEMLVLRPDSSETLRLTGDFAEVLRRIQSGNPLSCESSVVERLVEWGIVSSPQGVSRRTLVTGGAIGVGVGLSVLAMPASALALSPAGPGTSSSAPDLCEPGRAVTLARYWIIEDEAEGDRIFFELEFEVTPAGSYSIRDPQFNGGAYTAEVDSFAVDEPAAGVTWISQAVFAGADQVPVEGTWDICANFELRRETNDVFFDPEIYRVSGFRRVLPPR